MCVYIIMALRVQEKCHDCESEISLSQEIYYGFGYETSQMTFWRTFLYAAFCDSLDL